MSALEDAVNAAEEAEAAAAAKVSLWRHAAVDRRQKLAELEERIGQELLAHPDRADELMEQVDAARRRAESAQKTADAARGAWEQTRAALPLAQAEVIRAQAAKLWAEATERQEMTLRLLADLAAHEGVDYGVVTLNGMNGAPALTRTEQLIEQAQRLDASAVALTTVARGEGVQVSLGPIAPGGMQTVCIQASATCEPGQDRRFAVLIDGEPWRQDDGREQWLQVSVTQRTVLRTLQVPVGATVEVRGASAYATTRPALTGAAA